MVTKPLWDDQTLAVKRVGGDRLRMVQFKMSGREFEAIEQNRKKPSRGYLHMLVMLTGLLPSQARALLEIVSELTAYLARPRPIGAELLAYDGEVGLVRGQAEHDQVGVGAAQHVVRVRVVVGLGALSTYEVHGLVLALARHVGVREDDGEAAPRRIAVETLVNVVAQVLPAVIVRPIAVRRPSRNARRRCGRPGVFREVLALTKPSFRRCLVQEVADAFDRRGAGLPMMIVNCNAAD